LEIDFLAGVLGRMRIGDAAKRCPKGSPLGGRSASGKLHDPKVIRHAKYLGFRASSITKPDLPQGQHRSAQPIYPNLLRDQCINRKHPANPSVN